MEKLQEYSDERWSNVEKIAAEATDIASDERRSNMDGYYVGDLNRTDL